MFRSSKNRRLAKKSRIQAGPIENLVSSVSDKLSEAVEYGLSASIYNAKLAATELTTAQTVVLTLFYGLLYGDENLCRNLLALPVPHLRSTYLAVWLADDFNFSLHDVENVLAMMSFLKETGRLQFPDHVVAIFWGLVSKYDVANCCTEDVLQAFGDWSTNFNTSQEKIADDQKHIPKCCRKTMEPTREPLSAEYVTTENVKRPVPDIVRNHIPKCSNNIEETANRPPSDEYVVMKNVSWPEAANGFNTRLQPIGRVHFKWIYEKGDVKLSVESEEVDDEEFVIVTYDDLVSECKTEIDTPGTSGQCNCDRGQLESNSVIPVGATIYRKVNDNLPCDERTSHKLQSNDNMKSEWLSPERIKMSETERSPDWFYVTDKQGRNLLHRLAQFGRTEAIRRLVDEGIILDIPDNLGKTALHWASEFDHFETVALLLDRGANVNSRSKSGRTPLSYCGTTVSKTWMKLVSYGGTV